MMVESKFSKYVVKNAAVIILVIASIISLVPFLIVVSASFTTEDSLLIDGYRIIPKVLSIEAYKSVFKVPQRIIRSYATSIFVTATGSVLSIFLVCLTAYPLSRPDYKWRNAINLYLFFTLLFHGGTVSTYLLVAKYLKLSDTIFALILPGIVSAWNVILLRSFLQNTSQSLVEAAKIDGANEYRIFFQIVLPVAKTGVATIFMMSILGHWNDWYKNLMYMPRERYVTLPYYLYKILNNAEELQKNGGAAGAMTGEIASLPRETVRMAICVLSTAPMLFVFMFFQKYFVKGVSVGAVKG